MPIHLPFFLMTANFVHLWQLLNFKLPGGGKNNPPEARNLQRCSINGRND
jgi:hypothetical protein